MPVMELDIQPALSYRAVQLVSYGCVLVLAQIMGAVKLSETNAVYLELGK
jgi:hypothetical protein